MTTKDIIALFKEKLGKEITEQEAQDYLSGKTALPDEAFDIVSGGANGSSIGLCPDCNSNNMLYTSKFNIAYCGNCAYTFMSSGYCSIKCPNCGQSDFRILKIGGGGHILHCRVCLYHHLLREA